MDLTGTLAPALADRATPLLSAAVGRSADGDTAVRTLQGGAATTGKADGQQIRTAARDFEAQFLSQMLSFMFDTVKTDPMFGGGHGEDNFRTLLITEYGKQMAQAGGVGIADQVARTMLQAQEV